jgi:hypothetical protein
MAERNSKILMNCPARSNWSASLKYPATRLSPYSTQNGSFVTNESRLLSMELRVQQ